jgi:hypothetical protein
MKEHGYFDGNGYDVTYRSVAPPPATLGIQLSSPMGIWRNDDSYPMAVLHFESLPHLLPRQAFCLFKAIGWRFFGHLGVLDLPRSAARGSSWR